MATRLQIITLKPGELFEFPLKRFQDIKNETNRTIKVFVEVKDNNPTYIIKDA